MGRRTLINVQSFVLKDKRCFIYIHKQVFSLKQFHRAIDNIRFNLNILETNQSNDLTVTINPPSIYYTVQRNQRELLLARSGNKLQITHSID